jgi:hypothetical protein
MDRHNSGGSGPLFKGENRYLQMAEAIPAANATQDLALPSELLDEIAEASKASRAESARRNYQLAWRQFSGAKHTGAHRCQPRH